jgi:type IV secretory pathway VirB2 component (pilin)
MNTAHFLAILWIITATIAQYKGNSDIQVQIDVAIASMFMATGLIIEELRKRSSAV